MSFKTPPCTPRKTYRYVSATQQQKLEYCLFCGKKEEKSDNRRKLFVRETKTGSCDTIETFLGHPVNLITQMVCKFCLASISNTVNKIKKLKDKYRSTQKVLCELFGKNVSKRLVTDSPAKREKKKSKVHVPHDEDKENLTIENELGVAPLQDEQPVVQIRRFTEKAAQTPTVKRQSTAVQTESDFADITFDILVSVT